MSKSWPVLVLLVVFALTACTTDGPVQPTTSATPRPAASPAPVAAPAPDGVVATGTFVSATAQVSGGVVVTAKGGSYTARLTDFTSSDTSASTIAFSDEAIAADGCVSDRYQLAFSFADFATLHDMPLAIRPAAVDPGYLESLVVARSPVFPQQEDVCLEPTIAVAPLVWTLPDPFPDLAPAVDSGAVPAASGLSWTEAGEVLSYRTAPNDKMSTIAARFGLTEGELGYLNPERPSQYKDGEAYADEILNLVRAGR
jgi:hypothetical protein